MSERIHGLAQLLPGKSSLEECSLEELQHITKRYPYFAPAQFLLLQKLKENGSPDHEAQQRKAVLYYHDPLQFDYFISANRFHIDEAELQPVIETKEAVQHHAVDEILPLEEVTAEAQSFHLLENAGPTTTDAGITTNAEERNLTAEEDLQTTELPPLQHQDSIEEVTSFSEPDKVEENNAIEPAKPAVLSVSPLQESTVPHIIEENEKSRLLPEENIAGAESTAVIVAPSLAVVTAQEQETPAEKMRHAETGQTSPEQTIKPHVQESAGEQLAFEPYHTVDYFASQGIKITTEELPKDKLSKQLRSFTEWLKMMKRLPAAEMEKTPQSTAEKTVENMASHSVEGSDVVTEAMAEVWSKQGNKAKAIETYNKLSLLNPSKKAYFAAKIENLSGT